MIFKKDYVTPELWCRRWSEEEILTDVISVSGSNATTYRKDPFADFFQDDFWQNN